MFIFFFNDTATTEIYTGWYTLSLHDALPNSSATCAARSPVRLRIAKVSSSRRTAAPYRSEEHTSELQSHHPISYAVFCLKKKKKKKHKTNPHFYNIKKKKKKK